MAYVYFKRLNNELDVVPIFHNENPKAHGLQDNEVMDYLLKEEPGTILIPDAGSNDAEECKQLSELGWKIYISDHHEKSVDNPYAVIVNNQFSDKVTNKSLSGCGVTWKLLSKIDEINKTEYSKDLISYVHVANIADACNFIHPEQNTFRYWSLKDFNANLVPFVEVYNKGFSNMEFSFGMISKGNALIRVGSLEDKQKLFNGLCGLEAETAIQSCDKCYSLQRKQQDELIDKVKIVLNDKIVLAKIYEKTPLTGLLANKLQSKYHKPVLLVHERKNGEVSGSVRSPIDIREALDESGLFLYNRGHNQAFGTSYLKENEDDIIEYVNTLEIDEPEIEVLSRFNVEDIPVKLFNEVDQYKWLFGKGIEEPKVCIDLEYNPMNMQILGKNQLTLKYSSYGVDILWFFADKKKKEMLKLGSIEDDKFVYSPNDDDYKLTIVGTLGVNEWGDKITNQIIVEDFEIKKIKKISPNTIFREKTLDK